MKKIFFAIIIVCTNIAFAGTPDFPFLLVKGDAEVKVQPSTARVSFTVTTFNKDAKESSSLVFQRGQLILQLANKLGITPQYVTSTEYSKSTKRKQSEHFEDLEILGYEVTQTFTVEINNIIQYSPFVDQLLGMMNVGNIRTAFDVANREEIDSELLTKATKNAKQKAEDLAKGMNVKVGSVFALTQDYSFASFEAVFGAPEHQSYSAPPDFVPPPSFDFVPDQEGSNMFIPKTIELKKAVSVVFKIK